MAYDMWSSPMIYDTPPCPVVTIYKADSIMGLMNSINPDGAAQYPDVLSALRQSAQKLILAYTGNVKPSELSILLKGGTIEEFVTLLDLGFRYTLDDDTYPKEITNALLEEIFWPNQWVDWGKKMWHAAARRCIPVSYAKRLHDCAITKNCLDPAIKVLDMYYMEIGVEVLQEWQQDKNKDRDAKMWTLMEKYMPRPRTIPVPVTRKPPSARTKQWHKNNQALAEADKQRRAKIYEGSHATYQRVQKVRTQRVQEEQEMQKVVRGIGALNIL